MQTITKAYGKILVFGAYAILEPGNIGFTVNVDKGTSAEVVESDSGKIVIDLENFDITVYGEFDGGIFKLDKNSELLKFVKNAIGYTFKYLSYKEIRIRDLKLILRNDPGLYVGKTLKTGFGTSASSTVASVAAVLALHDIYDRDIVYKISRYSHFKSQGNLGSGFDIAASCYGSHFFLSQPFNESIDFIQYMISGRKEPMEQFDWPYYLIPVIAFTGISASTTELVQKVMAFKAKNPEKYDNFMHKYNETNTFLKEVFEKASPDEVQHFLEKSWKQRKELGELANAPIEPDNITRMLAELKSQGALTAGLIGAGGGDSVFALCRTEKDREALIEHMERMNFVVLDDMRVTTRECKIR